MGPSPSEVRFQLVMRRGEIDLTFTLLDRVLITDLAGERVEQTLESTAVALEHLLRVVGLRQRQGYVVVAERRDEAVVVPAPDDPLAKDVAWDPERRRMVASWRPGGDAAALATAIAARIGELQPTTFRLVAERGAPGPAWSAALAAHPAPSVAAFVFDAPSSTIARQARNSCGAIDELLDGLPAVERVFVTGDIAVVELVHPTLRELALIADPMASAALAGIADGDLPALESLVLGLAWEDDPPKPSAVVDAIATLRAPALSRLHLVGVTPVEAVLDGVLGSGRALRELVVTGSIDDEDALVAVLRRHAAAIAALDTLGLPLSSDLSSDGVAAAQAIAPSVRDEVGDSVLPAAYADW